MTSIDMTTQLLTKVIGEEGRVQAVIRSWRQCGYTEDEMENMAYVLWMMTFNSIYGKFGMRDPSS